MLIAFSTKILTIVVLLNCITFADNIELNNTKKQNMKTINNSIYQEKDIKILENSILLKEKATEGIDIKSIPEIVLKINQAQNWYLILLPITTIIIVIVGYLMTRKQLEEKTKESMNLFNKTIDKQIELSKDEIKIEVLSKNRQAWINTLRDELSKFMGEITTLERKFLMTKDSPTVSDLNDIKNDVNKLGFDKYKIYLLLNPDEPNSKVLLRLIEEIILKAYQQESSNDKINELVKVSQTILKDEWKRVKSLE